MISFKDFQKINLKIGKIVSVKDHPNADKLYIIKAKINNEERQLVAGLKDYYSPEELQNKNVTVLTNLEPAKIRGIESQGMLLAAEDEKGQVSIITTDKEIESGAKIH